MLLSVYDAKGLFGHFLPLKKIKQRFVFPMKSRLRNLLFHEHKYFIVSKKLKKQTLKDTTMLY